MSCSDLEGIDKNNESKGNMRRNVEDPATNKIYSMSENRIDTTLQTAAKVISEDRIDINLQAAAKFISEDKIDI